MEKGERQVVTDPSCPEGYLSVAKLPDVLNAKKTPLSPPASFFIFALIFSLFGS